MPSAGPMISGLKGAVGPATGSADSAGSAAASGSPAATVVTAASESRAFARSGVFGGPSAATRSAAASGSGAFGGPAAAGASPPAVAARTAGGRGVARRAAGRPPARGGVATATGPVASSGAEPGMRFSAGPFAGGRRGRRGASGLPGSGGMAGGRARAARAVRPRGAAFEDAARGSARAVLARRIGRSPAGRSPARLYSSPLVNGRLCSGGRTGGPAVTTSLVCRSGCRERDPRRENGSGARLHHRRHILSHARCHAQRRRPWNRVRCRKSHHGRLRHRGGHR